MALQRSIFVTAFFLSFFAGFSDQPVSSLSRQVLGKTNLNFGSPPKTYNLSALPAPASFPAKVTPVHSPPTLSAKAAFVLDRASHTPLFGKNARLPLPPASTSKIMTAVIALENLPLEAISTVRGPLVDGSSMGLRLGEQIRVEDLLWGLLLNSGNDAAVTLANSLDHQENFIRLMNQKALELNLASTHFENPVGFDQEGERSSALDLTLLADYALKKPFFAHAVATSRKQVSAISGEQHFLETTNPLLGKVAGVKGVKTGWTEGAGECLVVLVERQNHQVLLTILASDDREGDAEKLIRWVFDSFDWGEALPS